MFDDESAQSVLDAWTQHGTDLMVDYEHQALEEPPIKAPAAGWFEPELRDDGLWAVNVRWTPPAAAHLKNKEYRYYSPAFTSEKSTGRILRLTNVALTNLPATKGLTPLVAASERGEEMALPEDKKTKASEEKKVTKVAASDDSMAPAAPASPAGDIAAAVKEGCMAALSAFAEMMGMAPAAASEGEKKPEAMAEGEDEKKEPVAAAEGEEDEKKEPVAAAEGDEEKTEAKKLRAAVKEITGEASVSKAIGKLYALRDAAVEGVKLRAPKVDTGAKVEKLVDDAIRGGKLPPAKKAWALSYGKKDVAGLEGYLEQSTALVRLSAPATHPDETQTTALSADELELCTRLKITPEKYAQNKAKFASRSGR